MKNSPKNRVWAEIDVSALRSNVSQIRRLAPEKEIIAVVKANAYGHGDNIICPELKKAGVNFFAVSSTEEALRVREYVPDGEVLIFGLTESPDLQAITENNFIISVPDTEYAREVSDFAISKNINIRAHIKLNTGMNRLGINTERELEEILSLPGLKCEGGYTHFACSDSQDKDDVIFTQNQHQKLLSIARGKGLKLHSQNSAGVLYHSGFEADYVRPGLILYGYSPDATVKPPIKLNPVMTLKSVIWQIRRLEPEDYVSYGRIYKASEGGLAAIIPVGYADGYSRLHSNSGLVSINNTLCPVLGLVCMEMIIVDVSRVENPKVGGEVLLYSDKHKETNIEYIAEKLGTIPYEITCAVSRRVPRVI